tara:strand:+ start:544 stop:1155 length:612 start_codon:yes stop_codon:yes gene_type:complete
MNNLWSKIEKCSGKGGTDEQFESLEIENYCEIGVREGQTFKRRLPYVSKLAVAIDCWDLYETESQNDMHRARNQAKGQYHDLYHYCKSNDFGNEVKVMKAFSDDESVINEFNDETFDLIFIDGDHSYEGCKADLENWWPKVKPGQILCGHDYCFPENNPNGFGVKQAVDEFMKDREDIINFRVHRYDGESENNNPTYFIQKRK